MKGVLQEYSIAMTLLEETRKEMRNQEEKNTLTRAMMRMAMQAGDEKAMNFYLEKANKATPGSSELLFHKWVMKSAEDFSLFS